MLFRSSGSFVSNLTILEALSVGSYRVVWYSLGFDRDLILLGLICANVVAVTAAINEGNYLLGV